MTLMCIFLKTIDAHACWIPAGWSCAVMVGSRLCNQLYSNWWWSLRRTSKDDFEELLSQLSVPSKDVEISIEYIRILSMADVVANAEGSPLC